MTIVAWIAFASPLVAWVTAIAALVEWRLRGSGAMAVVTVVFLGVGVACSVIGVVAAVLTVPMPFDDPRGQTMIVAIVISELLNHGCWACGSGLPPAVAAAGVLFANRRRAV